MKNFITEIIDRDFKIYNKILTRFPPEPNGYLHIGHAKSICLNFGLANQYQGTCNLRFDDTNPVKENLEYINAIIEDVEWLGFNYGKAPLYASDYFDKMYDYAIQLIMSGYAYVDDQNSTEISFILSIFCPKLSTRFFSSPILLDTVVSIDLMLGINLLTPSLNPISSKSSTSSFRNKFSICSSISSNFV